MSVWLLINVNRIFSRVRSTDPSSMPSLRQLDQLGSSSTTKHHTRSLITVTLWTSQVAKKFTLQMVTSLLISYILFVSNHLYVIGEKERLKGKGLYFYRTTPAGKAVN